MDTTNLTVGCIGTGAMGGALMNAAALAVGGKNITVFDVNAAKCREFAGSIGATAAATIAAAVTAGRYIFLAVKPGILPSVLEDIRLHIPPEKLAAGTVFVSMAAGVPIAAIREGLGPGFAGFGVVRIMPNMPALVGQGMIACAAAGEAKDALHDVGVILSKAGIVEPVPEYLMDAVTGVSGSGPAFAFMFIEAMADAGVRCGMPREQAVVYAAQTLKGAAETVLVTKRSPAELKDSVCSPSGTTIEGVAVLEQNGFRSAVIEAVTAAWRRSCELGKK